jgi:hypothetical protein
MDGDGVRIVEAKPIALEGLDALRRGEQRLQVHPDHLVGEDAWVGVAAEQRHRLALGVALACEVGPLDQRLDLWWRPAIMHIAVGSGPMTSAGADGGRKDLRDGAAAAVVAHQIDPLDAERVQDLEKHFLPAP